MDTKSGNNLIYLPLDKIVQGAQSATPSSATLPSAVEQVAPAAPVDARSRDALRRREVR